MEMPSILYPLTKVLEKIIAYTLFLSNFEAAEEGKAATRKCFFTGFH